MKKGSISITYSQIFELQILTIN